MSKKRFRHPPAHLPKQPLDLQTEFRNGVISYQRGELAKAEHICTTILSVQPKHFDAMHLLGLVHAQRGELDAAATQLSRSVQLDPNNFHAHLNHANTLRALARLDEALASCGKAVALAPHDADALNFRGAVLMDLKRHGEALASFDKAVALRPAFPEAFHNRGAALMALARRAEALASFDNAVTLKPDYAEAFNNRGTVLKHLRRLEEAIASFDRAIALKPDYARARKNRAYCKLMTRSFKDGWADYEHRWKAEDFPSKPPALEVPHWSGESLEGRSILIYFEQGLGDAIQFSRYLALLVEGNADVYFLCPAKMFGILGSVSSRIRLIDRIDGGTRFDFQCALMSLPLRFGTEIGNIPSSVPYLHADPQRVARWQKHLSGEGFKIGVSWQGNPFTELDVGRSIGLREFFPISQIPGVRLISLQKEYGLDQLADLPNGMTVETLGDDFDTGAHAFVDTAAVMENLDLVIAVDSSVAHLAGALGRPTFLALKYVPDWRWMLDRSDSPWYPTMRLFRQEVADDWRAVMRRMAAELSKRPLADFSLDVDRDSAGDLPHPPDASIGAAPQHNPAMWGATRRNEMCPCGSGKRYKHCHGSLA